MNDPDGRWKDGVDQRLNDHSRRIGALERTVSWVFGAAAAIGVVVGAFADKVAHLLGLKS